MKTFKEHKLSLSQLLDLIPSELFSSISYAGESTNIDSYAKILHGNKMFYLLLYGILENDRLSQRTLEDTFNNPVFKALCNLDPNETVKYNSISERLSKINTNFFRIIYENVYEIFSKFFAEEDREKFALRRVDSCIISDTSGRFSEGFKCNQSKKKALKVTATFDGLLPSHIDINTFTSSASEDIALPAAILNSDKEELNKDCIYLVDQCLSSASRMDELAKKDINFIGRIRVGRKHRVEEEFKIKDKENGGCIVLNDLKV